jgi:hypothetical protein
MKLRHVLIASLAVVAAACGPFHLGSRERATLIFTNESTEQADVYAYISSTQTVRVGTVFALSTDTLTVPSSVTDNAGGTTNFVARLLARSYQPSTGTLVLRPDEVLHIRLSSDGRNLFVAARE